MHYSYVPFCEADQALTQRLVSSLSLLRDDELERHEEAGP